MTVGLIGAGAIGRWAAAFLAPMTGEIIVHDPALSVPPPGVSRLVGLPELYQRSAAISLHLPLTDETRHFLGREQLATMRPEAVLINVSRGALVDEQALADALATQTIAGAGLDAFEHEPLPADSPLRTARNVVLSPHAAWYSTGSRDRVVRWTVADVESFLGSGIVRFGRLIG
jgi:D-3-phosphoglycerate dehydrogenase